MARKKYSRKLEKKLNIYSFPEYGVSIQAENQKIAYKLLKEQLKGGENK